MRMQDVESQARQLYEALGPRAIATAARRAVRHAQEGRTEDAGNWRRIQLRLKERRGPAQG